MSFVVDFPPTVLLIAAAGCPCRLQRIKLARRVIETGEGSLRDGWGGRWREGGREGVGGVWDSAGMCKYSIVQLVVCRSPVGY